MTKVKVAPELLCKELFKDNFIYGVDVQITDVKMDRGVIELELKGRKVPDCEEAVIEVKRQKQYIVGITPLEEL